MTSVNISGKISRWDLTRVLKLIKNGVATNKSDLVQRAITLFIEQNKDKLNDGDGE